MKIFGRKNKRDAPQPSEDYLPEVEYSDGTKRPPIRKATGGTPLIDGKVHYRGK